MRRTSGMRLTPSEDRRQEDRAERWLPRRTAPFTSPLGLSVERRSDWEAPSAQVKTAHRSPSRRVTAWPTSSPLPVCLLVLPPHHLHLFLFNQNVG